MSGPPNRASRIFRPIPRGFTFLELMLVIALIAIIFIGSVPLLSASARERRLRDAATSIEQMVRAERREALQSGERRALEVRPGGFFAVGTGSREILPMPDLAVSLRAPEGKWNKPDGQRWEFSATGLVTPYSVRFQDGDAWMEVDFDLLTGRRSEERYAF